MGPPVKRRSPGLSAVADLEFLDASFNRISSLGLHLRGLSKLHTLRIASNRLETLSGLSHASGVVELHAPGNRIEELGRGLRDNLKLQRVNLASNRIRDLSEVFYLTLLPELMELHMADLDFSASANPVCKLKNFETFCIYHLPHLKVSKQSPVSASPASSRPTVQEAKIVEEALRESLIVKQMVLARMEELKQRAERSLLWEHESAGNVFFERGTPAHDWYNDVVHLVTSRFHLKEFQPLSVKGVQVKAVTKIHNRLLEHRFNEHHARLVEDGGSRSEVLFYGVDPAAPQEMHWVCRRGFLSAEKANERGIHPFVPLCTSLYGADAPRLRSFFKTESSSAGAREVLRANEEWHLFTEDGCVTAEGMDWVFEKATMLFPPGELLICRAIIHQPTLSCLMVGDDHVCGPSALWQKKPMAHLVPYSDATEETEVEDEDKDGIREAPTLARSSTASYRYREGQPHDKYWWILSPDVVLPLYHVVIGYETEERSFASPWSGRQLNRKIPSDDERRRLPECRKHAGLFAEDLAHRSSSAPVGSLFSSSTDTSQPLVALEARAGEAPSDACAEDEHDTLGEFLEILNFYRSFVSTSGDLTRGCGHSASYRLGKQLDGGTSACDGSESGMDDYRSSSTEERTMPLRTAAGSQKRSQVYLPPRSCQTQASDGFGDRSAYRTHGLLLGGRGVLNEATLWGHDGDQLRRALKINSETDYRSMTSIELPNAGLIAIEPSLLERAHQLRELRLPWNKIKSFEDILPCVGDTPHLFPRLTLLDVSFNEIKDVPAFIWAPDLRTLDVSFNEISDVQSIKVIATRAPNIEELRIKGNPVACVDSASESFCGALPRLLSFDGDALRKTASSDRNSDALTNKSLSSESALSTYDLLPFCYLCPPAMGVNSRQPEEHGMLCSRAVLSVKKAFELKASCGSEKGEHTSPLHASGAACAWTETGNSAAEMGAMHLSPEFGLLTRNFLHGLSRVNWPAYINCIELPSQKLSTVPDLRIFSNLRRAVLSHNKLSSLQPLLACAKLETVIASDNFLVDLGELYQLQELRHLDVAQNMIKEFPSSLDAPRKLCFLALENNLIEHVSNLELFDNLTQLFLSYNRLSDFRSIIHLGSRGGLKVLDLAGNPLCRLPDYRDYTLYLLNGLKILDGIAVNSKHQVQIREAFSGKVTAELLEQLLGSAPPYAAESVDLGDRNLRHLGDVITSFNFPNVKEMNLDGNLLTSLAGVEHLPKLEVLCINRNRVEIRGRSLGGVSLNDTRHFPNLQNIVEHQPPSKLEIPQCCKEQDQRRCGGGKAHRSVFTSISSILRQSSKQRRIVSSPRAALPTAPSRVRCEVSN
ncbi:leucine rich repeat-containing protein [Toxoplasma gondii ME49]|uniref:Leucine rich repeat-containing protein n=2 Tax=Toxoplasma gondii TaxID=5811 RepID=S8F7I8_TOXGM|nr:leucine rich repeat-containing protein [Toxoplasma gondii ME49]EPT29513.1 leucine rich repeat-containing protein [Toxoplasma gondii ME49]KYF41519.1 leucine rich repeat-containing protein [Toxoplasma gondii ARI]|eukprot:XP_018637071.1 leucine rich repeat-containing protein [Toxoplasma gondii ME49]